MLLEFDSFMRVPQNEFCVIALLNLKDFTEPF